MVKIRFKKYRSSIKAYQSKVEKDGSKNKDLDKRTKKYGERTVARHFYEVRHRVSELKWQTIEKIYGDDTQQKNKRLLQEVF